MRALLAGIALMQEPLPDVRDATGAVPNRFQPAYLDPVGRSIRVGVRKLF